MKTKAALLIPLLFLFHSAVFGQSTDKKWVGSDLLSSPGVKWTTLHISDLHCSCESPYPFQNDSWGPGKAGSRHIAVSPDGKFKVYHYVDRDKHYNENKTETFNRLEEDYTAYSTVDQAVTCSGRLAELTVGTFKDSSGVKKKVKILNVKKYEYRWVVIVDYVSGQADYEKMSERVIGSVNLNDDYHEQEDRGGSEKLKQKFSLMYFLWTNKTMDLLILISGVLATFYVCIDVYKQRLTVGLVLLILFVWFCIAVLCAFGLLFYVIS
jgi:hypothetical protein